MPKCEGCDRFATEGTMNIEEAYYCVDMVENERIHQPNGTSRTVTVPQVQSMQDYIL